MDPAYVALEAYFLDGTQREADPNRYTDVSAEKRSASSKVGRQSHIMAIKSNSNRHTNWIARRHSARLGSSKRTTQANRNVGEPVS
jgi:hypothetical protein